MATYAFVGELGDGGRLHWGGTWSGNTPKRIGPFLENTLGAKRHPHALVHDWIKSGRASGQQVDWGAHAADVSVADLEEFVSTCFSPVPDNVAAMVAGLDRSRRYALVAAEL